MSKSLDIENNYKRKPVGISSKFHRYLYKKQKFTRQCEKGSLAKKLSNNSTEDDTSSSEASEKSEPCTAMDWTIILVKVMVYITLQVIAILEQFGAVFFMLSLFYLMWVGLSDKKRKPDQLSAYSVFNPNFEEIDGTVNAKKLQAELTFGALHQI